MCPGCETTVTGRVPKPCRHGVSPSRDCPDCNRRYQRWKKYNLTEDQFLDLIAAQGGACAICRAVLDLSNPKDVCIDHDHACCSGWYGCCGQCVRGILCARCNHTLGHAKDDPDRLEAAAAYIRENRRKE